MSTVKQGEFNGILDTGKPNFQNILQMCTAASCFFIFDYFTGKWKFIPDNVGSSVKSFDDSNILGAIEVHSRGLDEFFTSVTVEFPHKDLRDTTDIITVSIQDEDRYFLERDNDLKLTLNLVTDPVQAQFIAAKQLKQNRLDKIIKFSSDFTANGLKASDIISITSSMHDFTNKLFRIVEIEERDEDNGSIIYSILAVEYDADVYSSAGLIREYKTIRNGIPAEITNEEIDAKDKVPLGIDIGELLEEGIKDGIIETVFGIDPETGAISQNTNFSNEDIQNIVSNLARPDVSGSASAPAICEGSSVTITLANDNATTCADPCSFKINDSMSFSYPYTITGVTAEDIDVPLTGNIDVSGGTGSLTITAATNNTNNTMEVEVNGETFTVEIYKQPTGYITGVSADSTTITEGDPVTVTFTTTGFSDGTNLLWYISGNTEVINTPGIIGYAPVSSNTVTIPITTIDDGVYNEDKTITVTLDTETQNPCQPAEVSIQITVQNDDASGPQPTTCVYAEVPLVWCGTYNGSTGQLEGLTALKTAKVMTSPSTGSSITIPTEVSVTSGNPSTITVTDSITAYTASNIAGIGLDIITSFDTISPNSAITGTISSVKGFIE